MGKILSTNKILEELTIESPIVFTNGCFDILHVGHVSYLQNARNIGRILIVGINSDDSVKRLKGKGRPINNQKDRAIVLASLECVSYVTIFKEDTPFNTIKKLKPDILVKGLDYKDNSISGQELVEADGGKVMIVGPFIKRMSTSNIIKKISNPKNKA